jgi:DNA topoisomerase-6 subunit B
MQKIELQRPPTDCLSPVGRGAIEKSIRSEFNPEFISATTRPPNVYRGYPFQVEAAIAYGGDIPEGETKVFRIANKVPLLYESGACSISAAINELDWKRYGVAKSAGSSLPQAPLVVLVHFCSVWVPFTSESKAAIANYPIILKEIKLALQDCARQLQLFLHKKMKAKSEAHRISTFIKFSKVLATAVADLARKEEKMVQEIVQKVLEKKYSNVAKLAEITDEPAKEYQDTDAPKPRRGEKDERAGKSSEDEE